MLQKMMTGALIAGIAAGLLAAVLHFSFIQPLILLGERYESGELVHFSAPAEPATAADSAHDHVAHDHSHDAPAGTGLSRDALTVAFTVLIYVGYALMLTAGFGIAAQFGHRIGAAQGALWGLAGFAAFQLAPGMGLAPMLPGSAAADLAARQVWWWSTVVATGGGLALIGYGRGLIALAVAAVLLAAPHVIGAPVLDAFYGFAPTELGAAFSTRVLGVGLAVWVTLGLVAGREWSRSGVAG